MQAISDCRHWNGTKQWGNQENGSTSCTLPIAFSTQKFKAIGIHIGGNSINVIALSTYEYSLTQTGFKTFSPNGEYNDVAYVNWICIGK